MEILSDPLDRLTRALVVGGADPSSDHDFDQGLRFSRNTWKAAAVLVAILPGREGPQVILTRRAQGLKHHAGQIAFPGGKADAGDGSATGTALRESAEEIGLRPDQARIIGELPVHHTVTGFAVTPVVALIDPAFAPVPDLSEVDEIFTVPLGFLLAETNYTIRSRRWNGVERHFPVVPWGPYYIWGATARILWGLAGRCR